MIVYDEDGVAHEVYNKTECKQLFERWGQIECWQVSTLCRLDTASLGRSRIAQADMGAREHGDTVTCIRCASLRCDHGVTFDARQARGMHASKVRQFYPRLDGECPKGCGYRGIYYVSTEHYTSGDW